MCGYFSRKCICRRLLVKSIWGGTFTGAQQLSGAVNIPVNNNGQFFVHSNFLQTELQNLSVDLTPYIGQTIDLGSSSNAWNNLHIKGDILPTGFLQ